jgi:hypothetical protein
MCGKTSIFMSAERGVLHDFRPAPDQEGTLA